MKKILAFYFLFIGTIIYSQKINGLYNWNNSSGGITLINFKKNNSFEYKSYSDLGPICFLNKGYYIKHQDTLTLIYDNPIEKRIEIIKQQKLDTLYSKNVSSKITFEIINEKNEPILGAILVKLNNKNKVLSVQNDNNNIYSLIVSECEQTKSIRISWFTDEVIIPIEDYEGYENFVEVKLFSEKRSRYAINPKNVNLKFLEKKGNRLFFEDIETRTKVSFVKI